MEETVNVRHEKFRRMGRTQRKPSALKIINSTIPILLEYKVKDDEMQGNLPHLPLPERFLLAVEI